MKLLSIISALCISSVSFAQQDTAVAKKDSSAAVIGKKAVTLKEVVVRSNSQCACLHRSHKRRHQFLQSFPQPQSAGLFRAQ